VARNLGIPPNTLYRWISQYKDDPKHPYVGSGHLKPEARAARDLEWENRELREDVEILVLIFSKNQK
jgi:transposase